MVNSHSHSNKGCYQAASSVISRSLADQHPHYLCAEFSQTVGLISSPQTELQIPSYSHQSSTYWSRSGLGIEVLLRWDSPINGHTLRGSPLPAWESPDHGPRQPRVWPKARQIWQIDLFPYFCQLKAVQVRWDDFYRSEDLWEILLEPFSFQDSTLRKARDNTEVFNILS